MKTLVAILAFGGLAAAAEIRWADPRGFFDDEVVTGKTLRPGLREISAAGKIDGRPIRSHLVVADLKEQSHGPQRQRIGRALFPPA